MTGNYIHQWTSRHGFWPYTACAMAISCNRWSQKYYLKGRSMATSDLVFDEECGEDAQTSNVTSDFQAYSNRSKTSSLL
ncbi:hypothetical protein Tco_0481972 [Tanacetum coccineum]